MLKLPDFDDQADLTGVPHAIQAWRLEVRLWDRGGRIGPHPPFPAGWAHRYGLHFGHTEAELSELTADLAPDDGSSSLTDALPGFDDAMSKYEDDRLELLRKNRYE